MEIRYHLDEHVDPATAAGLRQRGVDVTTTAEEGLVSTSDEDQLAHALANQPVIIGQQESRLRHAFPACDTGAAE